MKRRTVNHFCFELYRLEIRPILIPILKFRILQIQIPDTDSQIGRFFSHSAFYVIYLSIYKIALLQLVM